jgi:GT2 family glycosyltransferase
VNPLISIVTLAHNKLAYTRRCLTSWLRTAYAPFEIVVIDNGSTDGTREWLAAFTGEAAAAGVAVRCVYNDGNVGCSTARNQGIAQARGAFVVFCDNDVALRHADWLTRLAARFDEDAAIAIVGPRIVYPYAPYAIQCAGVGISRSGRVQFIGRGEPRDDARFNTLRDAQCLISACCMVRRTAIDACGGFDEAFNPVEFEDFDLCYRYRSRGHRVVYDPAVEMYHFESVTTAGTRALPNTYLIIKNGLLFKQRWRHMFEREDGPPDSATKWKTITPPPLESIGDLPIL